MAGFNSSMSEEQLILLKEQYEKDLESINDLLIMKQYQDTINHLDYYGFCMIIGIVI